MADFNVIFTLSETEPIIASFVQSEEQSIKAIFKIDAQVTKLSQLENDANYVQDADYVHTDNNFTDTEQTKLSGIADGAQVNVIEIVKKNGVALTVTDKTVDVGVPTALSELSDDSTHRLVTDTEKSTWNGKQDALGFTPENVANKVSSFQVTPDNTHYPTEKLVKDSLDGKVDKVTGKGLSTNDLTDTLKTNYDTAYTNTHTHSNKTVLDNTTASFTTTQETKLSGIQSGAEVNVQSDWNVSDTGSDAYIKNKPTIPSISGLVPYTGANNNVDLGLNYIKTANIIATQTDTNPYNNPYFFQLVAGDPHWAFGSFANDSTGDYWMQALYFDIQDGNRGFRAVDYNTGTSVFSTNLIKTIIPSGNFLLGTTSQPEQYAPKLNVHIDTTADGFGYPVMFKDDSSAGGQFKFTLLSGGGGVLPAGSGDVIVENGVGNILFSPNADGKSLYFNGGAWNKSPADMWLNSNGNIILGSNTDDGVNKLQISGSSYTSEKVYIGNQLNISNETLHLVHGTRVVASADSNFRTDWAVTPDKADFNAYRDDYGMYIPFAINANPIIFNQDSGGNVLIGTTTDNNLGKLQVNGRIIGGGGTLGMGLPYEASVFSTDGDTKLGVYTNAYSPSTGSASVTLGYTNFADYSGYRPGFEFQLMSDGNDDSYVRYNWVGRDNGGYVSAANIDLFDIHKDGRITINSPFVTSKLILGSSYDNGIDRAQLNDSTILGGNVLISQNGTSATRQTHFGIPYALEIQFNKDLAGYSYPMGFKNLDGIGGEFAFTSFSADISVAKTGDTMIENPKGGMIFAPLGDIRLATNGWTSTPALLAKKTTNSVLINTETDDTINKLQVNGASKFDGAITTKTQVVATNTTLDTIHQIVIVSNGSTITLPTAVGITGRQYNIIRSGTANVLINTTSSQTISGQNSITLTEQWSSIVVVSDGSNWVRCS